LCLRCACLASSFRFRLDLNDNDAEAFMAGIITESCNHVGIQVLEGFHNVARLLR
jgi:hypothetical protein